MPKQRRFIASSSVRAADRICGTRTPLEIEALIDRRVLFVGELDGALATACFLDDSDETEVEMGGAYTAPEFQGKGYASMLAVAAIVHFHAMNARAFRLVSHVVTGNGKPRNILDRLGFEIAEADGRYPPDSVPGIAHMETGPDGMIHADLFEFVRGALRALVDEALWIHQRGGARIDLPSFEDDAAMIREFRAAL